MDRKEIEKVVLEELSALQADIIYLFGSFAKDEVHAGSDVDIAFLSGVSYHPMDIFLLAQKISKRIGREVDLVQITESSTVFQKEVVAGGLVIFQSSQQLRDRFELLVFKKYMRLNEERAGILSDLDR